MKVKMEVKKVDIELYVVMVEPFPIEFNERSFTIFIRDLSELARNTLIEEGKAMARGFLDCSRPIDDETKHLDGGKK